MKDILSDLQIITAIILLSIIIITTIVYSFKVRLTRLSQNHEREMKTLEFAQKKEWETLMTEGIRKREESDKTKKRIEEYEKYKKRVDELYENKNNAVPLDINRIALLHHVLSGNRHEIDPENLEKEIKKMKRTYDIIKDCLKTN